METEAKDVKKESKMRDANQLETSESTTMLQTLNVTEEVNYWKHVGGSVSLLVAALGFVTIMIYAMKQTTKPGLRDFNEECLKYHNQYREIHNVPPLTTSNYLIEKAQRRAKERLTAKSLGKENPGENSNFHLSNVGSVNVNCKESVQNWYMEYMNYCFDCKHLGSNQTRHFTQMVWKKSSQVGCGYAADQRSLYVVCYYKPVGNNPGTFLQNVLKSSGKTELDSQKELRDKSLFDFNLECVKYHNQYRMNHGLEPIKVDKDLAKDAMDRLIGSGEDWSVWSVWSYVASKQLPYEYVSVESANSEKVDCRPHITKWYNVETFQSRTANWSSQTLTMLANGSRLMGCSYEMRNNRTVVLCHYNKV